MRPFDIKKKKKTHVWDWLLRLSVVEWQTYIYIVYIYIIIYLYIYIHIVYIDIYKRSAHITLFHVLSLSCMDSFCLHFSHPSGWLRGFVPTLLPLPRWWKTTLSLGFAFFVIQSHTLESGRKIFGQDVLTKIQEMQHGATRSNTCLSCCKIPKVVAWGLASASWQHLLQWCGTKTRSTSRMGCWHLQKWSKTH